MPMNVLTKLRSSLWRALLDFNLLIAGYPAGIRSVQRLWNAGTRARDWDIDSIQAGIAKCKGTPREPYCRLMAYYHAHDCGDNEEAYSQIKTATSILKPAALETNFGQNLNLELAYIRGILYIDLPEAKATVENAIPSLSHRLLLLRASASVQIALNEGDPLDTLRQATLEIEATPGRMLDNMQAERDWQEALRQRANRTVDA